ncbi:MAG: OmpA family protein [Verrucomicrobiaceae bacterium]|nr:OmpA family protein [Verrucomicrobiaceae bacterium]
MVFLSVTVRLDFRTFAKDLFAPIQEQDTFTAAFKAPENIAPIVVPEMEQITVASQVTIYQTLAGSIHITGVVPIWRISEEIEKYCQSIFPGSELVNEIRVFAKATTPQWLDSLKLLASLERAASVKNASIALPDSIIEMTGSVPTKQLKSEILAALEAGVPGDEIPVAARLGIRTIAPELDMWMADKNTLLVQGALDEKSKAALVAKINAHLGDRRMVETISTEVETVTPDWIGAVEMMIPYFLTNVSPEQFKVKDRNVLLRGVTGAKQIADAFGSFLLKGFPTSTYIVTNELEWKEGLSLGYSEIALSAGDLPTEGNPLFDALSDSTIYFRSGSTGLGSGGKRKLRRLASLIQRDGAAKIEIVGHCDPSGAAELNAALAKRRCSAACDYLVGEGVPEEDFLVKPVSGKAGGPSSLQRRVDFRISWALLSKASDPVMEVPQANPTMKSIALHGDEGKRIVHVKAYAGATLYTLLKPNTQFVLSTANSSRPTSVPSTSCPRSFTYAA